LKQKQSILFSNTVHTYTYRNYFCKWFRWSKRV